jgi:tRNA (cytidine32/uridine32-2'-O)-methyltransferase
MLSDIRIILINTSHPGNIGAVARAMKTMGLSELYLVAPELFPHQKAIEMASNAADTLENAVVVQTLDQAISDCHLVVGASARSRTIPWPMLSPRELGEKAIQESSSGKVAIIFGREDSGLTNEELQSCHFHVHIPSNPDYSSLNLAAAVQVIAYELRVASLTIATSQVWDYDFANVDAMNGLYEHLERVMIRVDFLNPKVPRQLMARLRRLFNRARPDVMEMNILRGILGSVEKKLP